MLVHNEQVVRPCSVFMSRVSEASNDKALVKLSQHLHDLKVVLADDSSESSFGFFGVPVPYASRVCHSPVIDSVKGIASGWGGGGTARSSGCKALT